MMVGLGGFSVVLAIMTSIAQAQPRDAEWVNSFRHDVGMVSVDRRSLRREAGAVTLRSRITFNQVQGDGTKAAVMLYRYNCAARTAELLTLQRLASDGRVLESLTVSPQRRRATPVGPGSPNAGIIQAACA